jgi:L-alanine-DL-glutamate epimerase-like enolase superfamily enzyme
MKIVNAECILLSIPFEAGGTPPWSFGGKPAGGFDTLLVKIETEEGLVGWGEATIPVNGKVKVPAGPGLGIVPDERVIRRYSM